MSPRLRRPQRVSLALLLICLCGAALGWGMALTSTRLKLEAGPAGWTLQHPDIPLRLARLAGPPRLPGQGWPLDGHGLLGRDQPGATSISAVVQLPEGGQIELRLGGRQPGQGLSLMLSRVGKGMARVAVADSELTAPVGPAARRQWLDCDGPLPVPGADPVDVGLALSGQQLSVWVGELRRSCRLPTTVQSFDRSYDHAALRSGLRRVGIHSLSIASLSTGDAPSQTAPGRALGARLGGALVGVLVGLGFALAARRARLRLGLLALTLLPWLLGPALAGSDLDAALQACRISADQPLHWAIGLPLLLSASLLGLILVGRFVRPAADPQADPPTGLSTVLLVAVGAGAGLPVALAVGPPGLLALPLGAALALGLRVLAARLGPAADRAVVGSFLLATAGGLVAWAMAPRWGLAVPYAEGGTLLIGLVVWANVRAAELRAFNLVSLACIVGALAFAEQSLTWTATGMSLVGVSSRSTPAPGSKQDQPGAADSLGTAFHSFEALENVRKFQAYPMADYPVKPPLRSAPLRIAALGSSSTAGAYQNDDIADFWPADLDRLLGPQVQVINQGVGGWTSLHIARYVQTRQDVIDADILVIYLGHNDVLTDSPRPYKQLYATWKTGTSPTTAVSEMLGGIHLYQLLRFSLQSALSLGAGGGITGGVGPAVPVGDARDNFLAVLSAQRARGGKLLLVSEGVAPDASVMQSYADMMDQLARDQTRDGQDDGQDDGPSDIAFLDGGSVMSDPARTGLFLDDCHLTRQGHQVLAAAVADRLRDLGWVP